VPRVSPHRSDEHGFTLVELLVVILLLGVVGTVVTAGLVSAMQHTRDSQVRIEAMAELQRGAERMTRELRAACPVMEIGGDGDQVVVAIVRDGETRYHEFYRDGDRLRHAVKDTASEAPEGGNVLITGLPTYDAGSDLLTFVGDDGEEVDTDRPRDVRVVTIHLRRELAGQEREVEVTTSTSLRNGGRACD
jgi:prepilin-type N-terminal cleavage/methylation domain-containing protein